MLFDVLLQIILSERGKATIRARKKLLAGVSQVVPLDVADIRRLVPAYSAEEHHTVSKPDDGSTFEDARDAGRTSLRQGDGLRRTNRSTKRFH